MDFEFIERPSPNFDERQLPVSMIVLHYTGMPDMQGALDRLTSPEAKEVLHREKIELISYREFGSSRLQSPEVPSPSGLTK